MPTTAERNALLFLAAVALVGGGVRTMSTTRFTRELGAGERLTHGTSGADLGARALAAQIDAIDSARAARATKKPARKPRTGRSKTTPEPASPSHSSFSDEMPTPNTGKVSSRPPPVVDVNRATAAELEKLPRVGPALARRIVAWRETHGRFQSIEDLRHVRGIGPATAALLAPSVTF